VLKCLGHFGNFQGFDIFIQCFDAVVWVELMLSVKKHLLQQ